VLYVDKKEFNFLYKDGATVHLMQPETFEQVPAPSTEIK
jgi:translation elongation factor P/translation initiation factor 5A